MLTISASSAMASVVFFTLAPSVGAFHLGVSSGRPTAAPQMSASAILERAPPVPPPTCDGGGGGGDGDGEGEFLRLLTTSETSIVFSDWQASPHTPSPAAPHAFVFTRRFIPILFLLQSRARIYKMSDTEGISERQTACLDVLAEMEAHRANAQPGSKQLTIGLFDAERVWALSSADVSASDGLVVRSLTVHPQELNDESSTASLRLLHGLHVSASAHARSRPTSLWSARAAKMSKSSMEL